MVEQLEQIRLWVEGQIDEFINKPDFWGKAFTEYLSEAGIEPNLETVLSMMVGMTYGCVVVQIHIEYQREMTGAENVMIKELIKRRAFELRIHYVNNLYK